MTVNTPDTPTIESLLLLSKVSITKREIERVEDLAKDVDWVSLTDLAVRGGIPGLVAQSISRLALDAVPQKQKVLLVSQQMLSEVKDAKVIAEVERICGCAYSRGLALVPFKGVALQNGRPYEQSGLRTFCDIDLVALRSELNAIESILTEEGYVTSDIREYELDYLHHIHYSKIVDGMPFTIELHWTPFYSLFGNQNVDEQAIKRAEFPEDSAARFRVFDIEDTIISLVLHLASHRFCGALKWAVDVASFVVAWGSKIDWSIVEDRVIQLGAHRAFCFGLSMACEIYGIKVPVDCSHMGLRFKLLRKIREPDGFILGREQPSFFLKVLIDIISPDKLAQGVRNVFLLTFANRARAWRIRFPPVFRRRGYEPSV